MDVRESAVGGQHVGRLWCSWPCARIAAARTSAAAVFLLLSIHLQDQYFLIYMMKERILFTQRYSLELIKYKSNCVCLYSRWEGTCQAVSEKGSFFFALFIYSPRILVVVEFSGNVQIHIYLIRDVFFRHVNVPFVELYYAYTRSAIYLKRAIITSYHPHSCELKSTFCFARISPARHEVHNIC